MCRGVYARARLDSPTPVDPTRQQLGGSRRRAGSLSSEPSPLCLPTPDGRRAGAISTRPSQSTITEDHNASPSGIVDLILAGGLVSDGGDGAPGGGHNDPVRRAAAGVHGEALLRHVPDEARRDPLLPRHPPLRHGLLRPGAQ